MTLFEKLQLQSDLIKEWVDSLSYIELACSYFMNQLPEPIAVEFYEMKEVPDAGIECGTKYSDVLRWKYPCRQIISSRVPLAEDEDSQFYATKFDPVFFKRNGKLYVLPEPTEEEKAYVNKIPTSFIEDFEDEETTEIPKIPENAEHIVLLYAAYLVLYKRMRDARDDGMKYVDKFQKLIEDYQKSIPAKLSFDDFEFEQEKPEVPELSYDEELDIELDFQEIEDLKSELDFGLALDLDYDFDLDELNEIDVDLSDEIDAIDTSINDPSFVIDFYDWAQREFPEIDEFPDLPDLDMSGALTALENARGFIGDWSSDTMPQGAFWNKDEDPEMVQSTVQLASQEVNRANGISNTELSKVQLYTSKIEAIVAKFRAQADVIISEVQARTADINGRVSVFTSKIDARAKELEARINTIRIKLESAQTMLQIKSQKAQIEMQYKLGFNQSKIDELNAKLNRYSITVQAVVQREGLKLQEYQTKVQSEIQRNQQLLEHFAQEFGAYSNEFQLRLTEYQTNLGNKFQKIQSDLEIAASHLQPAQVVGTQFEVENSMYAKLVGEAQMVYQKYENEFAKFLGMYGSPQAN